MNHDELHDSFLDNVGLPIRELGPTTNENTAIDHIISRARCGVHETYFSYHKALWATLNAPPSWPDQDAQRDLGLDAEDTDSYSSS